AARRGSRVWASVNGRFPWRRTTDGKTWRDISGGMPPALCDANGCEAGFASSGTCVATQGESRAWIGTGGVAPSARIFITKDGADHWVARTTPLRGSPSAGIFSVAFRDARHGLVAGGDLDPTAPPFDTVARPNNGRARFKVVATA